MSLHTNHLDATKTDTDVISFSHFNTTNLSPGEEIAAQPVVTVSSQRVRFRSASVRVTRRFLIGDQLRTINGLKSFCSGGPARSRSGGSGRTERTVKAAGGR